VRVIPAFWTPHRRDDGELIGWIRPEPGGELWVAVDMLGREASGPIEWLDAEKALEQRGLSWLAEIWMLDGGPTGEAAEPWRVRLVEVTPGSVGEPGRVVVQTDDFGAIDVPVTRVSLPWPAPASLRLRRPGESGGSPFG
jgi:hypothetical protein